MTNATPSATTENVVCLGCGCACDDIETVVRDGRIAEARNACALGVRWFGDGQTPARSRIDGRDASVEQALTEATRLLSSASRPLVYLAPDISCETQREGTAIADMLRARLDSVTSSTALSFVLSGQERGYASATLGEIRNRADVIVFWAVDLDQRYPRFASRYAPEPAGAHVSAGRRSRTVVAVDVGGATTLADANQRVTLEPADESATLVALQALARSPNAGSVAYAGVTGTAWDTARHLAPVLLSAHYLAVVYDAEPDERAARSPQRFDALTTVAQALNESTRCAAIALRAGGNRSGADSVLTTQTGYPMAVDFARGAPRYAPYDGPGSTGSSRSETDVALVIGDATLLPPAVAGALATVRTIAIGPHASDAPLGKLAVAVDTGTDGIHADGTALRTDDVALPLRVVLAGAPSAAATVRALASLVRGLMP
jgi:formylmethanofuran dehydrogenase subunit B